MDKLDRDYRKHHDRAKHFGLGIPLKKLKPKKKEQELAGQLKKE